MLHFGDQQRDVVGTLEIRPGGQKEWEIVPKIRLAGGWNRWAPRRLQTAFRLQNTAQSKACAAMGPGGRQRRGAPGPAECDVL